MFSRSGAVSRCSSPGRLIPSVPPRPGARLLGASPIVGGVTSPGAARRAAQDPAFDAVFEYRADRAGGSDVFREYAGMDAGMDAAVVGAAGPRLSEALAWVRDRGRIAWLHDTPWGSPETVVSVDLSMVDRRGIRIEGFGLRHHLHRFKEIEAQYADEVRAGRLGAGRSMDVDFHGLIEVLVAAARSDFQPADVYRIVDPDS